jgi:hypothetical protein
VECNNLFPLHRCRVSVRNTWYCSQQPKHIRLHVKWTIIWRIVTKFGVSLQISWKSLIPNFTKIRPVRVELIHADRQTDGRTDRHDEGNRRFSQLMGGRLKRHIKAGTQYTEANVKKKGGIEFSVGGAHYKATSPAKSSRKSSRVVLRLDMWW